MSSGGLTALDDPGALSWRLNQDEEDASELDYQRNNIYNRRILPDKTLTMPQYYPYQSQYYGGGGGGGGGGGQAADGAPSSQDVHSSYSVNLTYRPTSSPAPSGTGSSSGNPANGYAVNSESNASPASHMSANAGGPPPPPGVGVAPPGVGGGGPEVGIPQLVSRTTTRNSTQQVTTVTKVIKSREYRHVGPDGQILDYVDPTSPNSGGAVVVAGGAQGVYDRPPFHSDYATYGYDPSTRSDYGTYDSGRPPSPGGQEPTSAPPDAYAHYAQRPHSPASEASSRRNYDTYPSYQDYDGGSGSGGHLLPLSPTGGSQPRSPLPPPEYALYHMRDGNGAPSGGTDVRWRDPDLQEVIEFLHHPNNTVKANASAYLQHLCYSDDHMKQKARGLGAIPPLVDLLRHDITEVHRNACGALRNLSYGRQNDENKRAVKNAGGIPALVNLLRRTNDNDVKELVTGILWNLSSCEDLKKSIIEDGLSVMNGVVIIPHSGWDRGVDPSGDGPKNSEVYWSTVFRNASGVLRNVSSAGEFARRQMRECEGLVDSLLYLVKAAIGKNDIDNKSVENCVCVLRNLSYRCQEQEDPNYDQHELPPPPKVGFPAGDNLGCFGGSKKKKDISPVEKPKKDLASGTSASPRPRSEPVRGMDLLWQPEVVKSYLDLLADCSNPETLEAAAGAIQNLAACYWQPSIDIRASVRKAKGLPILVELLRMEVDRVVCAVATALRNLALDQRNKELIGKYAMKDLVQKLPSETVQHDTGTSDETYAAVLATLNEVIRKNAEFARSLLEADGIDRLMYINRQRGRFSPKVVKFASQVLYNLWQHQELSEAYKKRGWKEANFVTRTMAARSLSPSNANSTLNRPISTQGGTKYEDKTLQRPGHDGNSSQGSVLAASAIPSRTPVQSQYNRPPLAEEVPLNDMPYPPPPPVEVAPQHRPPVNREKKKLRQYEDGGSVGPAYGMIGGGGGGGTGGGPGDASTNHNPTWDYEMRQQQHQHLLGNDSPDEDGQHGGDSWV